MSNETKLTRAERLILFNQYEILERLDPKREKRYSAAKEALSSGYELAYPWYMSHITDAPMSSESCREVLYILSMFDAVQVALRHGTSLSEKEAEALRFIGFDGNDETEQMAFAIFLTEDENKFPSLETGSDGMNSHCPTMLRYRAMLHEWQEMGKPMTPTDDQLRRLAGAQ